MKSNGLNTGQTLGWFSRLRCSGRFLLCRTQRFAPGLEGLGLGFILCPYLAAILSILNAKTTIIHLCCKCLKINCRNGTHLVATLFVPFRQGPPLPVLLTLLLPFHLPLALLLVLLDLPLSPCDNLQTVIYNCSTLTITLINRKLADSYSLMFN